MVTICVILILRGIFLTKKFFQGGHVYAIKKNEINMGYNDIFKNQSYNLKFSQCNQAEKIGSHQYINAGNLAYQGYKKSYNLSFILDKIRNNRNLKILVGILGSIFVVIIIIAAIILIPLIIKLFNFISQNGIQGIIDSISGLFNKIWIGGGK